MSTSRSMKKDTIQSIKSLDMYSVVILRTYLAITMRNQIRKYERDEIVEELVRYYLKGQGVDL